VEKSVHPIHLAYTPQDFSATPAFNFLIPIGVNGMSTVTMPHEYVGIHQAAKLAGRSQSWIATRGLRGEIEVVRPPGRSPQFKVADIEALKASDNH
jgi:hypothetical protein